MLFSKTIYNTEIGQSKMGFPILLIMPLSIRIALSFIVSSDRIYDEIGIGRLITDPSFLSMLISGVLTLIALIAIPNSILQLFRPPMLFLVAYGVLSTAFSLFLPSPALGIFIGYELLIYYFITCIVIQGAVLSHGISLFSLEKYLFLFYSFLIAIALLDLALPWTNPFDTNPVPNLSDRKRFDGELIRLISIQWSTIAAVILIMSVGYAVRQHGRNLLYLLLGTGAFAVLFLAGSRGAFFGALTALFVLFLYLRREVPVLIWFMAIFAVCVSIGFSMLYGFDQIGSEVASRLRLDQIDNTRVLGGRTVYWSTASDVLLADPLTGYGIGRQTRPEAISASFHNAFLEAWASGGFFGLLFFTFGVLVVGMRLHKAVMLFRNDTNVTDAHHFRYLAVTCMSIFVYELVHSLVESGISGANNFFTLPFFYCVIVSQYMTRENIAGRH